MKHSYDEFSVMNYLGKVIGEPTDEATAIARAEHNQRIANSVGDRHYNYHVVKRRVYVGPWKKRK